jgi:hypothetical protein
VIVWHVLHHQVEYTDLGVDYYTQPDSPDIRKARLLRQLKELGYDVETAAPAFLPGWATSCILSFR